MAFPQNILEFLNGAQGPQEQPDTVQGILTNRWQPTAQDVGNAALAGISNDTYVNPQQYSDNRMTAAMKQMMAIAQMNRQQQATDINSKRLNLGEQQFAETQRHNMATENRLGNPAPPPRKPIPPTALKMQQEGLDAIGTANSIDADLGQVLTTIEQGKLNLNPVGNTVNRAMNWAGISNEESRNFGTFNNTLEKLRNDSLRLNKGVQTEGDAQRAWNEILTNINDTELVKQRLKEVQQINRRAADLHQMNIDQIRENYGYEPIDTSGYKVKPAIMNTQPTGGMQTQSGIKYRVVQ